MLLSSWWQNCFMYKMWEKILAQHYNCLIGWGQENEFLHLLKYIFFQVEQNSKQNHCVALLVHFR